MNNKEQQFKKNSPWLDEKDWLNGQIPQFINMGLVLISATIQ